ncbi:MAG: histidine phosphatase family protein [Rubrivivax sp.]|nr:histidine phosphatase family protein [Rubrivivax sp.]
MPTRRHLLIAGATAPWMLHAQTVDLPARLREGGVVLAFRHALAPGTFDPPEFRVGDCGTQRNLSDEGRAQARRLGERIAAWGLAPAAVRTSPWCRCIDTARLAFGTAEVWDWLGSPHRRDEAWRERQRRELRAALRAVPRGRFEAWVTHQFVLSSLVGEGTSSAEGLLLAASADGADGPPRVLARLAPA